MHCRPCWRGLLKQGEVLEEMKVLMAKATMER
jgi:hypothetical protein